MIAEERGLLAAQIVSGELDDQLDLIADALKKRRVAQRRARTSTVPCTLAGDMRPKYLSHATGEAGPIGRSGKVEFWPTPGSRAAQRSPVWKIPARYVIYESNRYVAPNAMAGEEAANA